jgi:predicted ribosome quality control (RQC) complex YloA/Tae2 family protein
MENYFLSGLIVEISPLLVSRRLNKVWLIGSKLILDFRLPGRLIALADLEPHEPGFYLIHRDRFEALQPEEPTWNYFSLQLRKRLLGAKLAALSKPLSERAIKLDFESGDSSYSLVITLTGRSANAHLLDPDGRIVARLAERGGDQLIQEASLDLSSALRDLGPLATREEIELRFFGPGSILGPPMKAEFIARCELVAPWEAIKWLLEDIFEKKPVPLIYSPLPLQEIGARAIEQAAGLLLSRIPLVRAKGLLRYEFASLSEAAEQYYMARERASRFEREYRGARRALLSEIKKCEAARSAIEADLARFSEPERFKRYGDLILANLKTAQVAGDAVKVVDYYDPDQPQIEIQLKKGEDLKRAASRYYDMYSKARRALERLRARADQIGSRLERLKSLLEQLERDPNPRLIEEIKPPRSPAQRVEKKRQPERMGRRFSSSDGYEIVVGRSDWENDAITFRLARGNDIWLHAADYPGSHVVILNPQRKPIPHRTVLEAAQLAAFYSRAKNEAKVAVNYTERKYVSKPPRAEPGLVRLSSFRTVLVEPRCDLAIIED